jgi:hypothetical protein
MPSMSPLRSLRRCSSASIAALTLLLAGAASASPSYPAALQSDLGLAAAPGCDLCHHAATAPVGDVDKPFGKSMVARGLIGNDDDASVATALARMRADGVDSDGDGAEDLDELSWGGDPNTASLPEGGAAMPVLYGCAWSGRGVGGSPAWAGLLLVLASAALARVAVRRRQFLGVPRVPSSTGGERGS